MARMPTAYIALGSNLGDRAANLRAAVHLLDRFGVVVKKISSLYETEPVDYLDQPWFLNAALEATTELPPAGVLAALRQIEFQMGSSKPIPKGPRLIDLDILLYDAALIDTPTLQVPHPRMLQRNFVLAPLAEIAPNLRHPSWPATVAEILANSPDRSAVRKLSSTNKRTRST
jgi:2-amino-4-hydroxy-6-hydroxymethyldihydropteridine diphosphokinase